MIIQVPLMVLDEARRCITCQLDPLQYVGNLPITVAAEKTAAVIHTSLKLTRYALCRAPTPAPMIWGVTP